MCTHMYIWHIYNAYMAYIISWQDCLGRELALTTRIFGDASYGLSTSKSNVYSYICVSATIYLLWCVHDVCICVGVPARGVHGCRGQRSMLMSLSFPILKRCPSLHPNLATPARRLVSKPWESCVCPPVPTSTGAYRCVWLPCECWTGDRNSLP